ncbi:hypothetical protein OSJ20_25605, partial [Mycobacterium ulcerans]
PTHRGRSGRLHPYRDSPAVAASSPFAVATACALTGTERGLSAAFDIDIAQNLPFLLSLYAQPASVGVPPAGAGLATASAKPVAAHTGAKPLWDRAPALLISRLVSWGIV